MNANDNTSSNAINSNANISSLKDLLVFEESAKDIQNIQPESNKEVFFIPKIKLVGYGRSQTYQCVCVKCNKLYFNLNEDKHLVDLFCGNCEPNEIHLHDDSRSFINFVGIIVGWEIKSSEDGTLKRCRYNYKKVYKRDRYTCQYCGYCIENASQFRPLHIDHIKPWTANGSNRMQNMVVSCSKCNLKASNKWFNSFEEKKKYLIEKFSIVPYIGVLSFAEHWKNLQHYHEENEDE